MIKSLIRANSNNKGIFIVITYDKDLKPILLKKSSSSKESIKNLKNEVRGVEWYSGVSRKSFIKKTTNLEDYFSIDYEYVTGKKANFRKGYLHNLSYIEKAIKIYCELWVPPDTNEKVCLVKPPANSTIIDKTKAFYIRSGPRSIQLKDERLDDYKNKYFN